MGLSSAFLRMKDRVKDQIGNFFYPQEEFPDDYDMPRESSRRTRDVAPVPQTPQVSAPVYNDSQDPFRQGYMPPRTAETAEQSAPVRKEADNLVYFPGAEENAAPEKERESAVRVINARSVTDCYSAITQLRANQAADTFSVQPMSYEIAPFGHVIGAPPQLAEMVLHCGISYGPQCMPSGRSSGAPP